MTFIKVTMANIPRFDPYDHLHLHLNPDGSITRLLNFPNTKETPRTNNGELVVFKDVILDAQKNTSLRICIPSSSLVDNGTRLPIIIYFHGCSWVMFGAKVSINRCYDFCSIPSIIILVDCRLPPENRLPAQYEDLLDALKWLKNQSLNPSGDEWIMNRGDLSRCFLYGADSGANIVFNTALRVQEMDLKPVNISGFIMNQPMFGGKQRTKSELKFIDDELIPLASMDLMWELTLPTGADRDHPFCNPMVDGPHLKKLRWLQRCLVIGFGQSPMVDRQQESVEMLAKHGAPVEAQFDPLGQITSN